MACLAAVVGLGAVLRLYPVWFGLPCWKARPEENAAVGHGFAVMQGDLNPHFFHWPSLTFYMLRTDGADRPAARSAAG